MSKKRSSERVKQIDDFIKKHYPDKGSKWCSDQLGEPPDYIMTRANTKNIKLNSRGKYQKETQNRDYYKRNNLEIKIKRIKILESLNRKLISKNLKLSDENGNLKRRLYEKTTD